MFMSCKKEANSKSAKMMPMHWVGLTLSYAFLGAPDCRNRGKDTVQAEMQVSACTFYILGGKIWNTKEQNK